MADKTLDALVKETLGAQVVQILALTLQVEALKAQLATVTPPPAPPAA